MLFVRDLCISKKCWKRYFKISKLFNTFYKKINEHAFKKLINEHAFKIEALGASQISIEEIEIWKGQCTNLIETYLYFCDRTNDRTNSFQLVEKHIKIWWSSTSETIRFMWKQIGFPSNVFCWTMQIKHHAICARFVHLKKMLKTLF